MHIKLYIFKKFKNKLLWITSIIIFCTVTLLLVPLCFQADETKTQETNGVKLPVIMYHLILKNPGVKNKFIISEQTFEQDLKYLSQKGYTTILIKDLIEYTQNQKELPKKPILLTFDDGAYNNYLYAFPLAKKYNAKFVFSPIIKETEKYSNITDENPVYAHVSWEKISEMANSNLVEIQNHTYNMHESKKPRIGCTQKHNESFEKYKSNLTQDIEKAQQEIKKNIGFEPTGFFYPFGAYSKCSEQIIKSMGFKATFDCEGKMNFITKNPDCLFRLHRFLRPPNISSQEFFSKIEKNKN